MPGRLLPALLALACASASCAPDEIALGRDAGYPVARRLSQIPSPARSAPSTRCRRIACR